MRVSSCAAALGMLLICSTAGWGFGILDWTQGYNGAVATAYQGFGGMIQWDSMDWTASSSVSVTARTNTYPAPGFQTASGPWTATPLTAQASSSNPGPPVRSAYALARADRGNYQNFTNVQRFHAEAQTTGSPSTASAQAFPLNRYYWTAYLQPIAWYQWKAARGPWIPFLYRSWYWGWFDGLDGPHGIAAQWMLKDNVASSEQLLFSDGFFDNGDGTFRHTGSGWDASSLVYNTDVGGTGHAGWDLAGHDPNLNQDPYEMLFFAQARELGTTPEGYVIVEASFDLEGEINTDVIPEPSGIALLVMGISAGCWSHWRRAKDSTRV